MLKPLSQEYHMNQFPYKKCNSEIEEIELVLKLLPSVFYLTKFKKAKQLMHWVNQQVLSRYIALCWKAIHEGRNNPLHPLLKAKKISKHTYNTAWLVAKFYEALWELIQVSFEDIQPHLETYGFPDYPYDSAVDLFSSVVSATVNQGFAACLLPYSKVSRLAVVKEYRTAAKAFKGELSLGARKLVIKKYSKSTTYYTKLIEVIHQVKGDNDPIINVNLATFYVSVLHLGDYIAKSCSNDPSFTWINGDMIHAQKGGKYVKP